LQVKERRPSLAKTPYDLMRATFPAGTFSDAPKIRAMQIIGDLEGMTRNASNSSTFATISRKRPGGRRCHHDRAAA
jgi:anthranilate/para-aminobenzoate synthase component I